MPILGLNIGRNRIRAVELEKKRDSIIINNFGLYEDPKINLEATSKEDLAAVSQSLSNFIEDIGFSTSQVVVGLNERHVFMRVISLPAMSDKELKSSIKYEAEQYIPIPLDQVNLSYQKLDPDFSERNKVKVQIVAAKKAILERYVSILKNAKLTTKAIEPETVALGRVLGDSNVNPVGTLVLEMGYSSSLIIITYGGFVRFTRNIPIGGDVLTKTLQQELGLDPIQSEEYKKVYGMEQSQADGKVYHVLKPVIDSLILEVKRAQIFFTNHNPSANIKRIIITGGTALMPGLLMYLANNLDVEVQLANPIKDLQISPKLEKRKTEITEEAARYSTEIGLALRSFK